MKVKQMIELLQKQNPEADISAFTVGNKGLAKRIYEPKITSHKNMFGETVFIS